MMLSKLRMLASATLAWLILLVTTDTMASVLYRGEWLSVWAIIFALALLFIYASSDRPSARLKLGASSVGFSLIVAALYAWMASSGLTVSQRLTDEADRQAFAEAAAQNEQMMVAAFCQAAALLLFVLSSVAWRKWWRPAALER